MSASISSRDVVQMLQRHYLPEGRPASGVLAVEVGAPNSARRADAVWAPITAAGREGLSGHEIKVSRSDVIAELIDPTKADAWARYCDRWWLTLSDPALIDGLDVPEHWGIMAPPSGRRTRSMTIVRPAPRLKPADPAPGMQRLLSWHHHHVASRIAELSRSLTYAEQARDRAEEQARLAQVSGGSNSPHAQRIAGMVHRIETQMRESGAWESVDDDAVIDAVLNLHAVRRANLQVVRETKRIMDDVRAASEPFGRIAEKFDSILAGVES